MQKSITKLMEDAYTGVKRILSEGFPNLHFYVSPTGELSIWVKEGGGCGAAISMKYQINVGNILFHHWRYLQELNKLVEPVTENPREFFYCSECGEVKPIEQYADYVMAANFCKDCAKHPAIAKLIKESKKAGFYD